MWLNATAYRFLMARRRGVIRVHLGPGKKGYLPGWLNVDSNLIGAKLDVWADIRHGLPFPNASVDAVYSHHVVEHLAEERLPDHFAELFRVLKPGGIFRIAGPNGDMAIQKFMEGDLPWFYSAFPFKRTSIGGQLCNFLLCANEHLTILTYSYLEELARAAGFESIRCCRPRLETSYSTLIDTAVLQSEWEVTPDAPHTLVVEAMKGPTGGNP